MIKVTSIYKVNSYDCDVNIKGDKQDVLVELKTLFESIIQSDEPEIIHAVISHFLPEITDQIVTNSISERRINYYMYLLGDMKGGK